MRRIEAGPIRALVVALLVAGCAPVHRPATPAPSATGARSRPAARPAYLDPSLPVRERARDLLGRMTLDEKVSQMRYDAPAIPRLGIPSYDWWSEALHGVARAGLATVFPQSIGLAATFDDTLVYDVASAVSAEARAKHAAFVRLGDRDVYQGLTFFAPNINIFRDPRWGRGQETYGEDPLLTSRMAVAYIRGLQGDDPRYLEALATAKHFAVHDGPEPERHVMDVSPSPQDLWATYLPPFRAAVEQGHVGSIMCAYSSFRGVPDCANATLLHRILRQRWHFDGYVVSDCWAIADIYQTHKYVKTRLQAAAAALKAGTDLNCGETYRYLADAVRKGLVPERDVDRAVTRLLRARLRLGMFDDSARVPWDTIPYSVVASPAHRALALRAARESMVLLKNDGVLPLSSHPGTIAVIGPDARAYDVLVGEYNGTPRAPSYPLDAIRAAAVARGGRVLYAMGSELAPGMPRLTPIPPTALVPAGDVPIPQAAGLRGQYFPHMRFSGAPAFMRVDSVVDFRWLDHAPVTGALADSFAVRWTGRVVAPLSGVYRIGLTAMSGARLWFQDSLRLHFHDRHVPITKTFDVRLAAGHAYDLRIDYANFGPNPEVHLDWALPGQDLQNQALAAARRAKVVVLVLGLSPHLESEESDIEVPGFKGGDRTTLGLPAPQQKLLEAVTALGKPTVLVLMSGSALAVPWAADHVDAMLQAWYPGEAGGAAIADVLFGDFNPAGRLPVTVYRSVRDLPPFADYSMDGRTYRYFHGEPLYPFGYGLSYTTFAYSNLRVPARIHAPSGKGTLQVSVDVTNTGKRQGQEVVQLYVAHPDAPFRVPIRALEAFRRVALAPGETRTVSFRLDRRALSVVDPRGRSVILDGPARISVGGEQPGFTGRLAVATSGVLSETVRLRR